MKTKFLIGLLAAPLIFGLAMPSYAKKKAEPVTCDDGSTSTAKGRGACSGCCCSACRCSGTGCSCCDGVVKQCAGCNGEVQGRLVLAFCQPQGCMLASWRRG